MCGTVRTTESLLMPSINPTVAEMAGTFQGESLSMHDTPRELSGIPMRIGELASEIEEAFKVLHLRTFDLFDWPRLAEEIRRQTDKVRLLKVQAARLIHRVEV